MSAFHRIDDIYAMDAIRFFSLAIRLPAYRGVMAVRVAAEQDPKKAGRKEIGDSPAEIMASPLRDHIEYG